MNCNELQFWYMCSNRFMSCAAPRASGAWHRRLRNCCTVAMNSAILSQSDTYTRYVRPVTWARLWLPVKPVVVVFQVMQDEPRESWWHRVSDTGCCLQAGSVGPFLHSISLATLYHKDQLVETANEQTVITLVAFVESTLQNTQRCLPECENKSQCKKNPLSVPVL